MSISRNVAVLSLERTEYRHACHDRHDPLPASWGTWTYHGEKVRTFTADQLVSNLAAAYENLSRSKVQNYSEWQDAMDAVEAAVWDNFNAVGLEAAPLAQQWLRERIRPPGPEADRQAHLRFLRALLTNAHGFVWDQYHYRQATAGNLVVQWVGDTGMGKTTCALYYMDDTHAIRPEDLLAHVTIDVGELPDKLKTKQPGQWVLLDELLRTSGEGSHTLAGMLANVEDTMRAGGVNLATCSPTLEASAVTQLQNEVILWAPPRGIKTGNLRCRRCHVPWRGGYCACGWRPFSLFVCWVKGVPVGVFGAWWSSAEHHAVYSPWKAGNVERTLRATFRDRSFTAKQALKLLVDPGVVRYLKTFDDGKPRIGDFEDCVLDRGEGMLTSDQTRRIAQLMMRMCLKFSKLAVADANGQTLFQALYGVPPPPEVKELAARWEGAEL